MKTDAQVLKELAEDRIAFKVHTKNALTYAEFKVFMDMLCSAKGSARNQYMVSLLFDIFIGIDREIQMNLLKAFDKPEFQSLRQDYGRLAKFESLSEIYEAITGQKL